MSRTCGLLGSRDVDAVAHAQPVLRTMARRISGVRLLEGAFSVTSLAVAVPKGRTTAWRYVSSFIATAGRTGQVARAFSKAGLFPDGST